MANNYRGFAYIMAANAEALGMFFLAWWLGEWLNENHPIGVTWFMITFLAALIMIGISWYRMFRSLTKDK